MQLPAPNPDVIYKAVEDGAVLLSTADEVYYGLNAVGSYIWEHLPPVLHSFEELVALLSALYPDAPAEVIRADVRELLDDLLTQGLLLSPARTDNATTASHSTRETREPAPQGLG